MNTTNNKIVKETFFLGDTHVTIENPTNYFPETLTDKSLNLFLKRSEQLFNENFETLAEASRTFHLYSSGFNLQKKAIFDYLNATQNKQLVKETGICSSTNSELKNGKCLLENMTLKKIESLYLCAVANKENRKEKNDDSCNSSRTINQRYRSKTDK